MPYGPCIGCGATNYGNSLGGPSICPACDAGATRSPKEAGSSVAGALLVEQNARIAALEAENRDLRAEVASERVKHGVLPDVLAEAAGREERARIRRELRKWLIDWLAPEDAGLINGRRIVDEINRICPKEG